MDRALERQSDIDFSVYMGFNNRQEEYKSAVEGIIYPQKKFLWDGAVEKNVFASIPNARELEHAIAVMNKLHKGVEVEQAVAYMNMIQGKEVCLDLVTHFSKRGVEFYKAVDPQPTPMKLHELETIESQNKEFELQSNAEITK